MIARVDVPGTTIAGIAVDARLDRDGADFLFFLTSWPAGAVTMQIRMTCLEAYTLCGAIRDLSSVAVSGSDRKPDST